MVRKKHCPVQRSESVAQTPTIARHFIVALLNVCNMFCDTQVLQPRISASPPARAVSHKDSSNSCCDFPQWHQLYICNVCAFINWKLKWAKLHNFVLQLAVQIPNNIKIAVHLLFCKIISGARIKPFAGLMWPTGHTFDSTALDKLLNNSLWDFKFQICLGARHSGSIGGVCCLPITSLVVRHLKLSVSSWLSLGDMSFLW